jgi:hypothetical protein
LAVLAVLAVLVVGPTGLAAARAAAVVLVLETDAVNPVEDFLAVVLVDLAVLLSLSSRPSVDSGDLASLRPSLAPPEGPIPRTLVSFASAEGTRVMV